jgi:hypothetical protein
VLDVNADRARPCHRTCYGPCRVREAELQRPFGPIDVRFAQGRADEPPLGSRHVEVAAQHSPRQRLPEQEQLSIPLEGERAESLTLVRRQQSETVRETRDQRFGRSALSRATAARTPAKPTAIALLGWANPATAGPRDADQSPRSAGAAV